MVRAVGRIVVCVEAEAEVSTIRMSSRDRNVPNPLLPKIAEPVTDSTSNSCAELASPMPLVPTPANACMPKMTMA